jgi:hypothetical protein
MQGTSDDQPDVGDGDGWALVGSHAQDVGTEVEFAYLNGRSLGLRPHFNLAGLVDQLQPGARNRHRFGAQNMQRYGTKIVSAGLGLPGHWPEEDHRQNHAWRQPQGEPELPLKWTSHFPRFR